MGTLLKRTVFGLLFTLVVVGGLLTPWGLLGLVVLLSVLLGYEFFKMTVETRFRKEAVCISLASLTALVLLFFHFQAGLPLRFVGLAFIPVALAHILLLFDAAQDHAFPAAVYFPLLYVTLPLAAALWLAWPGGVFTWRLLLGLIVLLWLNDIGAYVFGVLGDLYESLLTRHAGVKDASQLIPGHGGLLDRFDDVLFVLPLAALYLSLFSLL